MLFNKNIFFFMLCFSLCMATGCKKDFLRLYPEGNLNTGIFYKTANDFQLALVGAYTPLRDIANNAYFMDEMRSDNAHYDYFSPDRGNLPIENLIDFLDVPSNAILSNRYLANYVGISRTNTILSRIKNPALTINDSIKNVISAEAKALRAHYYFDLVKNWGGVTLITEELINPSDAYKPRATADEIYAQVIQDLKEAISVLPNPSFTAAQTGRVTKGSASTELAAVYMQRRQFAEAIPVLQSVTQMGYSLLPELRDIFDPAKKNGNRELIFDVQYQSGTTGQSSNFIYRFTPKTLNTKVILDVSFNNTIGGWNVPTDNLIALYEKTDKRLDAFIGVVEGTINTAEVFTPTKVSTYSAYTPTPGTIAKLFPRKYYYPPYPNLNQNTDQNWPLYRYADVLLLLAEALNETGKSAEALPFLNQVRARAYGNASGAITTTNQASLRQIIADERRRELVFENKRWQDLIRTNQAIAVMSAYAPIVKAKYPYLLPQSYDIKEFRLLYPIPQREMDLNKELVQNPGY